MKPQGYIDPRPAEHFKKFYERPRTEPPDWVYRAARVLLTIPVLGIYRFRAIGADNVPYRGPVILAPNHFSLLDHFFVAVVLGRQVQFMAKSQLFRPPLDFILTHGGAFPVRRGEARHEVVKNARPLLRQRRGQHDDESFKTAHAILGNGGCVLMYAEGGRSRSREMGQPKSGVGRLVVESGVPVVPVAIHGSQDARDLTRGHLPPKVTVQFG